MLQSAF